MPPQSADDSVTQSDNEDAADTDTDTAIDYDVADCDDPQMAECLRSQNHSTNSKSHLETCQSAPTSVAPEVRTEGSFSSSRPAHIGHDGGPLGDIIQNLSGTAAESAPNHHRHDQTAVNTELDADHSCNWATSRSAAELVRDNTQNIARKPVTTKTLQILIATTGIHRTTVITRRAAQLICKNSVTLPSTFAFPDTPKFGEDPFSHQRVHCT